MRDDWILPGPPSLPPQMTLELVLLEYDGPQLVISRGADGRYLGVAADEDNDHVRWIFAPLTDTEIKALADGVVATRDLFLRPGVHVVDVDRDERPVCAWTIDGESVPEAALPLPGARLPEAARGSIPSVEPVEPELCLDGPEVRTRGLGFRPLADVLDVLQRLWTALAQAGQSNGLKGKGPFNAHIADKTELALASASHGSLVLHVAPADPDLFENIAGMFEELARAGDNPDLLATLLARVGPRVQGRYNELLESLAKHRLVLLSRRRRGGGAFLSGHAARRVRAALPKTVVGEPESFPAVGHFEAYDTAGKFAFVDEVSHERYDGNVLPSVLASARAITVGPGVRYAVSIQVTTYAASGMQVKQTYALAQVGEVDGTSRDAEAGHE